MPPEIRGRLGEYSILASNEVEGKGPLIKLEVRSLEDEVDVLIGMHSSCRRTRGRVHNQLRYNPECCAIGIQYSINRCIPHHSGEWRTQGTGREYLGCYEAPATAHVIRHHNSSPLRSI